MNGAFARWDRYPVSRGHVLVMPFRHTLDFFSMTPEERETVLDLVALCKGLIAEEFFSRATGKPMTLTGKQVSKRDVTGGPAG